MTNNNLPPVFKQILKHKNNYIYCYYDINAGLTAITNKPAIYDKNLKELQSLNITESEYNLYKSDYHL